MDKRYQVFVSSTYSDLKEERNKVMQTLMSIDCFPAGMELFPAIDQEQFEFIKKIIDDSDYYLVIIGGRYGTLSNEGISYTEKEYDYAIQKGLKVIALLHQNPDSIPQGKTDKDNTLSRKLEQFREKVSQGKLVSFWNNADELCNKLIISLSATIKTYPAVGWSRGNALANSEILNEVNELRKEKEQLLSIISENKIEPKIENLAEMDETYRIKMKTSDHSFEKDYLWEDVLRYFGLALRKNNDVKRLLIDFSYSLFQEETTYRIIEYDFQRILFHFEALNLIEIDTANDSCSFTEYGNKFFKNLMVVKSKKSI